MDAGGARLLRQTHNQTFNLAAGGIHQVGELVNEHDNERHGRERRRLRLIVAAFSRGSPQGISYGFAAFLRPPYPLVVSGQVARAERRHQAVTALHFRHRPAQSLECQRHVGHHRREQMRNALIQAQLQHLRVNQDKLDFIRPGAKQKTQQHGMHGNRFARPGGAGNEQMRHLLKIGHHRLTGNVLAQRKGQQ